MADFLFSTTRREPGSLARALGRWLTPLPVEIEERHGPWGSLAVAVPPHEPYALFEGPDALSVVAASPVVRFPDLPAALVGRGDRRRRLHEALAEPKRCAEGLDGHFAALRVETVAGGAESGSGAGPRVDLLTDRFGFVAVFLAELGGGRLIGTHVDAVADAAGRGDRVDLVSAADLVASYASTWPWTLYDGVRQVMPGSIHAVAEAGWNGVGAAYWRPREPGGSWRDRGAGATAVREAFRESVQAATAEAPEATVLLSGGEDSRAVLAAVPEDVAVRGVVFAEWESREVRVAEAVARAHGASLDVALRGPDHYATGFPVTALLAGSGHLFVDIHGLGLDGSRPLRQASVVLGGLSADSLLKGSYAPGATDESFRSPRLPGIREALLEAADERRNGALERLREWRPETAPEWLWLWPFSMRKHSGNVEGNRRLFRSWEAFHATGVLDVAATASPEDLRSGRLFRDAMRPFFRTTRWIPHAEYRFPAFGPVGNALALPALAAARGVRALATGELRVRHRPWPKWRVLLESAAMRGHTARVPLEDSPLADLFEDTDGPAIDGATARWYALRHLMLTQLGTIVALQQDATPRARVGESG